MMFPDTARNSNTEVIKIFWMQLQSFLLAKKDTHTHTHVMLASVHRLAHAPRSMPIQPFAFCKLLLALMVPQNKIKSIQKETVGTSALRYKHRPVPFSVILSSAIWGSSICTQLPSSDCGAGLFLLLGRIPSFWLQPFSCFPLPLL